MNPCAISIVFSDDRKKILLVKRCDVPVWVFPGGGIETGERPEEAVVREAWEESGIDVEIVRKVAEYTPVNCFTSYTHFFECKAVGGRLKTGEESCDVGFFSIDQLPTPFLHVHRYWLEDALTDSPTVIKKKVHGASWFHFVRFLFIHPLLIGRYLLSRIGLTVNSRCS